MNKTLLEINKTAKNDLLINLIITCGGVIIASAQPHTGWGWLVLLVGLLVAAAGTIKATWNDTPTFRGKGENEDAN